MIVHVDAVLAYLGKSNTDTRWTGLAGAHLPIVTAFVRSYTRGEGFDGDTPADDLAAVIIGATARSITNPEGVVRYAAGDYAETPAVAGFSLPETLVLNRYRKRAH